MKIRNSCSALALVLVSVGFIGSALAADQDASLAATLDREANRFIEAKRHADAPTSQDLEIRRVNDAISDLAKQSASSDQSEPNQDVEADKAVDATSELTE